MENTIILFVCPPKFCMSIVSSFSWELQWSEEKMLMQNLGGQTKSIMVFSELAYCELSEHFLHNRRTHDFEKDVTITLIEQI